MRRRSHISGEGPGVGGPTKGGLSLPCQLMQMQTCRAEGGIMHALNDSDHYRCIWVMGFSVALCAAHLPGSSYKSFSGTDLKQKHPLSISFADQHTSFVGPRELFVQLINICLASVMDQGLF